MAKELVGKIIYYFPQAGVAVVKVLADIKVGDKISIEREEIIIEQTIESMQVDHENVEVAKAGSEVGLKVEGEIREGFEVFRV